MTEETKVKVQEWWENVTYAEAKRILQTNIENMTRSFVAVGYYLKLIRGTEGFREDGYSTIWEFAEAEYGLQRTTASRWMAINDRFSKDGNSPVLADRYKDFGKSQLQEMLYLTDEQAETVTADMTVKEIREIRKPEEVQAGPELLSALGLPKTVRLEGSLITTPGCGNGKYDCFSCSRECAIRQEERYCRTAAMGNPFPCSQLSSAEWKRRMQFSLYKDECQLLHQELAPKCAGDGEPNPCCLQCEYKTCFSRCGIAQKQDEKSRGQVAEEIRKQQKEAEASRPEPTKTEIEKLYNRWIKDGEKITAADLQARYQNAGGNGGGIDWDGRRRGVRINHKKELTWAQIAKAFREIQEQRRCDASSTEACAMSHKKVPPAAEEKMCSRYDGFVCSIEEVVKKHFTKKGNVEGCAGCCAMCVEKEKCEYTCEAARENTAGNDPGQIEVVSGEVEDAAPEAPETVIDEPRFSSLFLKDILQDKEYELKQMEACNAQPDGKLPDRMMQEHRAVVAGLRLLLELTEMEEEAEDNETN